MDGKQRSEKRVKRKRERKEQKLLGKKGEEEKNKKGGWKDKWEYKNKQKVTCFLNFIAEQKSEKQYWKEVR